MIVFDISEIRYTFSEYLKYTGVEYTPDLFLKFLSGSLFRICGVPVDTDPIGPTTNKDLIVMNISQFDMIITKWLPMTYISKVKVTGFVGDYYIIRVVGNSGVLYHVSEIGTIHNTV